MWLSRSKNVGDVITQSIDPDKSHVTQADCSTLSDPEPVQTPTSSVQAAPNSLASLMTRRRWDETPLRRKSASLLLLAAFGGVLVGVMEARLGHQFWPFAMGLSALVSIVLVLSERWLCRPYDRLLRKLMRVQLRNRLSELRQLPIHRRDEIGQIARSVHELALNAWRDRQESRAIRRTLDDRVQKAVDHACRQIKQIAMRDPLTGLGNRRFLEHAIPQIVESVRSCEQGLLCVVIDVDNFKSINDQFGHAAGDNLLRFLADLIRGCVRRSDSVVRLGGDEFAVFLPACSLDRLRVLTEQFHALFRQCTQSTLPKQAGCDLSIGVSSLQRDFGPDDDALDAKLIVDKLIEIADERLYHAKREGKGRVAGLDERPAAEETQ